MKKKLSGLLIFLLLFCLIRCAPPEEFKVMHQVTGGIQTNCYLIYGMKSKEAALIDVGGPIDPLLAHIRDNQLKLKYILCTHGHFDHIIGVPAVKALFPGAKVIIHELDYKDLFTQKEWVEKNLGMEFIDYLKNDQERRKIWDFDVHSFGEPDIYIKDEQVLPLGSSQLITMHSPGHSPGCVCYYMGDILFSGDVLFHRAVGRTDVQNSSPEDQIKSVRRLYNTLSDETIVYPGHGEFTDIGSEKRENRHIRISESFL